MVFAYAGNNWIQVTFNQIELETLPEEFDGFKIVHIGDLHAKEFGAGNARLARVIEKQKPDAIFVTGDMINSQNDDGGAFIRLLEKLNGSYPVYCSLGNHEQIIESREQNGKTDVFKTFIARIAGAGGVLLDNQRLEIKREGQSIWIYGFTSALYHYTGSDTAHWEGAELKKAFLDDKMGTADPDRFKVLLAHNPKYFAEYAAWGADMVFSGHIHGGVIRLPFKGGLLSPDITFFPAYDAGLYSLGKSRMYVTRGLGNSVIPLRFLNRPEVAVIVLKSRR